MKYTTENAKINALYDELPVRALTHTGASIKFQALATGGGSISVKYEDLIRVSRVSHVAGKYQCIADRKVCKAVMAMVAEEYKNCEGFETRTNKKGAYAVRLTNKDDMRSYLLSVAYFFEE